MNSLLKPLDQYTPTERGDILIDDEPSQPYTDSPPQEREEAEAGSSSSSTRSGDSTVSLLTDLLERHDSTGKLSQRSVVKKPNGDVVLGRVPGEPNGGSKPQRPQMLRRTTTSGAPDWMQRTGIWISIRYNRFAGTVTEKAQSYFDALPKPVQNVLYQFWRVVSFIFGCLNVPLAAIILSVVVALVPPLQRFFFTKGTFVNNSVTSALGAMGNVAVPLILVVLGANLAKNTLPDESAADAGTKSEQAKMLWLSLICRMVIPTAVMTPILALLAKYAPVSIIDDPIFLIVCFLLSGAPSALQLAQMCQVNSVFVGVVSQLLFHSYVIWILPSTLVLVLLALECVEWAK